MAMTYATITGRITKPGSDDPLKARVVAIPQTRNQGLAFPGVSHLAAGRLTWGPVAVTTDNDGYLPDTFQVPTGIDNLVWQILAEPIIDGGRLPTGGIGNTVLKLWDIYLGEITEDIDLSEVAGTALSVVPADLPQNVLDAVFDARDDAQAAAVVAVQSAEDAVAVATGDLDPANKILLEDPTSETARALSALIARFLGADSFGGEFTTATTVADLTPNPTAGYIVTEA